MAAIQLSDADIPSCAGKVVVITGGSSGIGWATGEIFASHGARVFLLDIRAPQEDLPPNSQYIECDITRWADILAAFEVVGDVIDILVANAGVSEEVNYFEDTFDSEGKLVEPGYGVIEVNLRGTINVIKVGLSIMRRRKTAGSIVITSSATAYSPEYTLPVYSATKLGLIGLMRALRATLPLDNITINTVAPAATLTGLIPPELAKPIIAMGLPTSSADFVGLAIAYSAVALETRQVELYGKDPDTATVDCKSRWNGRTILTLGDRYTELEQTISDLRLKWFDLLEEMSLDEGSTYNEKLMSISRGDVPPDQNIPAEWIMYDLWEDMRACDHVLANELLEPVFTFMRAQTDKTRLTIHQFGEYLDYREKDVGQALLSGLQRYTMKLYLTQEDLHMAAPVERNCAKHIAILNDIYSWRKELLASKVLHHEGAAICSSVQVLSEVTALNYAATQRVLWTMCREWESVHKQLVADMAEIGSRDFLDYIRGLEFQMSGNERWSESTSRYHF
ncbi:hypothetical protein BDV36DRAFT_279001 [Aspergillus pseudocaelatus]|uniref:NAD(P)-binding protein n=1 Tax=Aspergillus pseudocaelatus TaxID=1825620 RepID=A0ABQ6X2C1_9EURO|nr:hypothetical protein BDV36DRAFT_279001 [Aspergillus pseudocaelatus]